MDMSSPRMHAAGPFLGRLASASDSRKIGLPLKRPVGPHRMERSRVVRDGAWCAPRKRLDLGHRAPTPSPPLSASSCAPYDAPAEARILSRVVVHFSFRANLGYKCNRLPRRDDSDE